MATQGEKIDELFKIAHTLTERVDALRVELKGIRPDVTKVSDAAADLTIQVALLNQELVALKAWKDQLGINEVKAEVIILKEQANKLREDVDKAGNRLWSMVPSAVGALVSGLLAAAVAYFISKK